MEAEERNIKRKQIKKGAAAPVYKIRTKNLVNTPIFTKKQILRQK